MVLKTLALRFCIAASTIGVLLTLGGITLYVERSYPGLAAYAGTIFGWGFFISVVAFTLEAMIRGPNKQPPTAA